MENSVSDCCSLSDTLIRVFYRYETKFRCLEAMGSQSIIVTVTQCINGHMT